jgi:hypothetical protein
MKFVRAGLVVAVLSISTVACARKPIALDSFTATQSIQEGEAAQMFWRFRNADSVWVDPLKQRFKPDDHAVVAPSETTTYRVIGYRPGTDSLTKEWTIAVAQRGMTKRTSVKNIAPQDEQEVATGPSPLAPSDIPSAYMRGLTSDTAARPTSLRITSVRASGDSIIGEAVLLDSNGNFLRGTDRRGGWKFQARCRTEDASTSTTFGVPTEQAWSSGTANVSAVLCIDNSAASQGMAKKVVQGLQGALSGTVGSDSVAITLYDHDILEIVPMSSTSQAATQCSADSVPDAVGLSAVYASAYAGLSVLHDRVLSFRTIIIVASSDDNASLAYACADVVQRARTMGASINVIRVGSTSTGYVYRYMAGATGGRFYQLPAENVADVGPIVREILYARKQRFRFTVPMPSSDGDCADVTVSATYALDGAEFADSVRLPLRDRQYRSLYTAVAAFKDSTDAGLTAFAPTLVTLGEQLMDDPSMNVELVGNVSTEYSGDAYKRGLERAKAVSSYLTTYGVPAQQISVRSEGNTKPLYYLQLEEWQRALNNRVEVRSLRADLEPFTVIVEQVISEELASKSVDLWESRGYKAYFEPVVVNRAPLYRVKLWGYATRAAGEAARDEIKKKYGTKAVVE